MLNKTNKNKKTNTQIGPKGGCKATMVILQIGMRSSLGPLVKDIITPLETKNMKKIFINKNSYKQEG
jgi:hypothetical protein